LSSSSVPSRGGSESIDVLEGGAARCGGTALRTVLSRGAQRVTLEEVANYIAVGIALVHQLVSEKTLRVVRIGTEIRDLAGSSGARCLLLYK
jgi:hypothetical protein